MRARTTMRARDRLAAGFLLLVMGAGSLLLFIGIPAGVLWALSRVTESSSHHFVLSLFAIPAAMVLFAPTLFWLNDLYLRVIGAAGPEEDEEDYPRRLRGPLERFLYASMVIALVVLVLWILFLAENPPFTVW
jgi:ABC-type dipeptide/oligopeptide/nickel transport system permease component